MRAIVSAIGNPPYGISQYQSIQPTLYKGKYKIKNLSSFVNKAKSWLTK